MSLYLFTTKTCSLFSALYAALIPILPCYTAIATSHEKINSVVQASNNVNIPLVCESLVEDTKEKDPKRLYSIRQICSCCIRRYEALCAICIYLDQISVAPLSHSEMIRSKKFHTVHTSPSSFAWAPKVRTTMSGWNS